MFFEIIRLVKGLSEEDRPKFLLAENVKNLLSVGRGWDFARCIVALGEIGYDVEWQLFNTKYSYRVETPSNGEFKIVRGIPQNRERVYMLARRIGATGGRKVFPIQRADEEDFAQLQEIKKEQNPVRLGNIYGDQFGTGYAGNVWDKESISPTLMTMQGGNRQPFVVDDADKIKRLGSYSPSGHNATSVVDSSGIAPTVMENHGQVTATVVGNIYPSGGQNGNVYDVNGVSPSISAGTTNTKGNGGIGSNNAPKIVIDEPQVVGGVGEPNDFGHQFRQGNRIYSIEAVSPALQANNGNASGGSVLVADKKTTEVRAVLTPDREEKQQNGRRMKDDGEPMFTLTAQDRHGVAIENDITVIDTYNYRVRDNSVGATLTQECGHIGCFSAMAIVTKDEADTD